MSSNHATHKLYHFKYSICSIMVRYAYALRGKPATSADEIRIEEEDVNIMIGEQLTEHFLCDINAAGEVPVLASTNGSNAIPDSVEITKFLATIYPDMMPSSKRQDILDMIERLHAINFFALTYAGRPESQEKAKAVLEQKLNSNMSQRYREAIEYKIKRIETKKLKPLDPDNAMNNETRAMELTQELDAIIETSSTGLCFGFEKPTALDAHLVVFVARMLDIGRDDIIPSNLKRYASQLMEGQEWKSVMADRSTLPPM